jgi:hypothetical protein
VKPAPVTMLEFALWYASKGRPVLPLFWIECINGKNRCACGNNDCIRSAGKHPYGRLVRHGVADATTNIERIKGYWHWVPQANIGMSTEDLVVLDIDPRHGGDETLRALEAEHGPLPHGPRSLTGGGGEHIPFLAPVGIAITNKAHSLGPGVDIKTAGGYIVVPPSLHLSGRRYCWSVDHHPNDVRTPPLPDWIAEALKPEPIPVVQLETVRPASERQAERQLNGIIRTIATAREGERDNTAFWGACRLMERVEQGVLDFNDAVEITIEAATRTGLSRREARRAAFSAAKTVRSGK